MKMAWFRTGNKPLFEPIMAKFTNAHTHHSAYVCWIMLCLPPNPTVISPYIMSINVASVIIVPISAILMLFHIASVL